MTAQSVAALIANQVMKVASCEDVTLTVVFAAIKLSTNALWTMTDNRIGIE